MDRGAASPAGRPAIDVAAGVLTDERGRILIAQRPPGAQQAGWWEFPGGKIDAGETPYEGLVRELREELGIEVRAADAFITFTHEYPERIVTLHVFRVGAWSGRPSAAEGQALRWERVAALTDAGLLPADRPIVSALLGETTGR